MQEPSTDVVTLNKLRKQIELDTAAFLAAGGEITYCAPQDKYDFDSPDAAPYADKSFKKSS